ncbi:MAG: response regulator [Nitrosomonadales bacterium]|nr:response regulator [Nitrosomonadales bacterium]
MESYFLHDRFAEMDVDLLEQGELIAHQLAASSEYGVFSNNLEFLQSIANSSLSQTDVHKTVILNADNRILVSAGEFSDHLKGEIIGKILATNERVNQLPSAAVEQMDQAIILPPPANSSAHSLWLYHPVIPAQVALDDGGADTMVKPVGAVIVEISKLRHEGLKARLLWTTLLATTLFLALACYLVFLASRSITNPIRKLSNAVQEIGKGKLDTRVSLSTRVRELATLAQGLNETTENLQKERAGLQSRIDEATLALRKKKEAAERASQDKSHFLAVASHDLRQPLHALGLYIAELQHKVSGAEQQHLVGRVEQSVEALSTLLNALLDISKLDAGTIVPQLQTCAASVMLDRVAADYQMLAGIKNIRLIVRPCAEYISSDPQLLERILMNLVGNAIRYTYPNGCVMVACRRRGNLLRIEVRDNGVGISKTDQDNIFREFFQVSQQRTDNNKGLGLGLAIVDRLVKLLGHRIELRSALGKGSIFALEVPLARRRPGKSSSAAQTMSGPGQGLEESLLTGKRLLVVDDDPMVLSSTASILASWGCIVSTAASLAQVRQFLRDGEAWDFIISDYQLGNNESGIDIVAMVRQHYGRQIPCVLISGDTSQAILKLASVSGHHLLHKPVRPAKLRSLIIYLLEMSA